MKSDVTQADSLFNVVEIEVNSRCNRKCKYCPVSIIPSPNVPEFMSKKIFDRILAELVKINYSGKVSYHFYSEPLLRDDLELIVGQVKEKIPNAYQLLFTNGILLSENRYNRLRKSGIDHFKVTNHDFESIAERQHQTVLFPTDLLISNRGGIMFKLREPLTFPCHVPSESLVVTVTGDVLLCCDDAKRSQKMGNVMEQSLEKIWFSKKFCHTRKLLKNGRRSEATPICKICNNIEYIEPGNA